MKQIKALFTWPRLIVFALIGAAMALDHLFANAIGTFGFAMAALTADRPIERRDGDTFSYSVYQAVKIYHGALVQRNATGYAVPASATIANRTLGVNIDGTLDNTNGSSGDLKVTVKEGIFKFENSADADLITITSIGEACYVADDLTVAKTSSGGTRPVAGWVRAVDSDGVWVEIKNTASVDGDLVAANNLSDVANAQTAVGNLDFTVATNIMTRRDKEIAGAAAYTVTAADGAALITTATDNAVITLPDAAAGNKGVKVTVMNIAAATAAKVSVSPHSSDKIIGTVMAVTFGGIADKDIINTKATCVKGDYVSLISDGVDSWYVVGGMGVWASEG